MRGVFCEVIETYRYLQVAFFYREGRWVAWVMRFFFLHPLFLLFCFLVRMDVLRWGLYRINILLGLRQVTMVDCMSIAIESGLRCGCLQ